MGSVGSNVTGTTTTDPTTFLPDATPTLSEREQLKIEFYKTYDVMTGVRIAATLGGFFSLMVLLVVYKSRCKASKQLEDPALTAAAAAAVAEAEAEEQALAAALEAIARLPSRPGRGPRRSLCVEVIQPTPDLSPCGSEAGLYGAAVGNLMAASSSGRRAPLASMGSVDPPDPDSRSLGSDSVFLKNEEEEEQCVDTEDEVSGFSTDSDAPEPSCRRFLRVPSKKKRTLERWDGCAGCVPRRRAGSKPCQACLTISAAVETSRSQPVSTTTSSSQSSVGSPPCSPPIELRHRPPAPLPSIPPIWSQETLF